jgi:hypothetical protein
MMASVWPRAGADSLALFLTQPGGSEVSERMTWWLIGSLILFVVIGILLVRWLWKR